MEKLNIAKASKRRPRTEAEVKACCDAFWNRVQKLLKKFG